MDFEKLGLFYLGRPLDPATSKPREEPLLYDARDLTTHAAIVGMTGSGKTGLGVALLEEAAIDGVPAVVIDPKGDLADLALAFPGLTAGEFRPWVKAEDAERKGLSLDDYAAAEAEKWKKGLAGWGQDGARVGRFRDAARVALFTPGSDVGTPVSILASFAPPPAAVLDDAELLGDRVETTVTSLLGLLGIDADPLRSREHILLATLFAQAWRAGRAYDLGGLIADLQKPPVEKVGVMEVETFFPSRDRFELAMRVNNLLAAPGFEVWTRGEALSFDRLLYDREGRPRLSVLSIAHLSDVERMFFVSLLLNEAVSWMRGQPGTSSLRALLYMDEVFGYLPPVANPPSKKPMLSLFKQARAFGLGVVVATQNPVDLDYKALGNIGTWCLGRLSTERDKERVLDGLQGVAGGGGFDRTGMDRMLSALRPRAFLMRNVHDAEPVLFETRWVLCYLAGPLDRRDLRRLAGAHSPQVSGIHAAPSGVAEAAGPFGGSLAAAASSGGRRPVLEPGVPEVFLDVASPSEEVVYEPRLLGWSRIHFVDSRRSIEESRSRALLAEFPKVKGVAWEAAEERDIDESNLGKNPKIGIAFAELPEIAGDRRRYPDWSRSLAEHLYRNERLGLFTCEALEETSRPGETERDFRIRLSDSARARRDEEVEALRKRLKGALERIEQQRQRAAAKVDKEREEASRQKMDSLLSIGSSVLGAFMGRKTLSQTNVARARAAARSYSRAGKEASDIGRAEEALLEIEGKHAELEEEMKDQLEKVASAWDIDALSIEKIEIKPRRTDVDVRLVAIAWVPV